MNGVDVLNRLLAQLWVQYKVRVPYAARYDMMVTERGGKTQNDHIAFRTFNCPTGAQPAGIASIARIFIALGYEQKDRYNFTEKKLTAWHYEHRTDPQQPKLFISQLEVDALPAAAAAAIQKTVANAPDLVTAAQQNFLAQLAAGGAIDHGGGQDLAHDLAQFFTRSWLPPERCIVECVNQESQYAAWTLLHGNAINHFTAYINYQNVPDWPDLEATVNALRTAGVPMKSDYEGERGSKLRQTSTKAVMEDCVVKEADGSLGKVNWSYAYYELAERGMVPGADGKPVLFQGFLGEQATNLFEMTKRS